ncbi:hypothetical protein IPF89_01130 [Candidatus Saccharibacteria bacterium]|nr:MAG: hypothetical protein IPF89_01130 [Candidatus Saccharibacteria bacterium]
MKLFATAFDQWSNLWRRTFLFVSNCITLGAGVVCFFARFFYGFFFSLFERLFAALTSFGNVSFAFSNYFFICGWLLCLCVCD